MALRVLRAHEVAVVLNTDRSVEDGRDYCHAYGLAGGVAQFGSVFVDAVAGRDLALLDAEGGAELVRCREAIAERIEIRGPIVSAFRAESAECRHRIQWERGEERLNNR